MAVSDSTRHALRTSLGNPAANEILRLLDRLSEEYEAEDDPARTTDEPNPGPDPNEAGVPVEPVTDSPDPVAEPEPEEDHADEVEAADADVVA